jgi:Ser/Thr protein kinase RdoA (MazF antagonist)
MIPTGILGAARAGFGLPRGRIRVLSMQFGKCCLAHTDRAGRTTQLRLVQEFADTPARLRSETTWLAHLNSVHGLTVPRPLHWLDGTTVSPQLSDSRDNAWRAIACTWVPGRHLDGGMSAREMSRVGRLLAQLHLAHQDAPPEIIASRPVWWIPRLLELSAPLKALIESKAPVEGLDAALVAGLRRAHEQLAAAWSGLATGPNHFGLIHTDAHQHNLRIARDRVGLVDFEDFGNGRFMFDIATLWAEFDQRSNSAPLLDALLTGYNNTRPLPDDYSRDLHVMLAFRRLDLAGWVLSWPRPDMKRWGPALLAETPHYIDAQLAR